MNDIQVDYATLVEIMTVELNTYQSQLIALKAKLKIYDRELTNALNKDVNIKKINKNQKDFIQPRLHGKSIECVAKNIGRKVLFDLYNNNGQEFADFVSELNFTEEETETLETMG